MPAAATKSALLATTEKEFARLTKLLDTVDDATATDPDPDGWSIRDVIAHRAHWIALYLGWFADGAAGRPVHMPAKGYGWGDLRAYNAALRTRQASLTWDEARGLLATRHADLVAHLTAEDDATLYGAPMIGGNGTWTAGRYAESAGPSHYRSAAKFIRKRLRVLAD